MKKLLIPLIAAFAGSLAIHTALLFLPDVELSTAPEPPPLLAELLDAADVVAPTEVAPDVVTMHSRCIYVDESTGTAREVELVYPEEADPAKGKISVLAPIGSALLGLAVGHSIDWELPGGRIHRITVKRVLSQPHERSA